MKHFNRRLGIKILCFILTIPLLVAAVASGYGLYVLWEEGFYTAEKPQRRQELFTGRIQQDGHRMMSHYANVMAYGDVSEITDLVTWPSNLRYRLTDASGKEIAANIQSGEIHDWTAELVYAVGKDEYSEYDYQSGEFRNEVYYYAYYSRSLEENGGVPLSEEEFLLQAWVDDSFSVNDNYRKLQQAVDLGYALRYWGFSLVAACLGLGVWCLVNLLATASRRPGSDELHPGKFHKVPSDVMALLALSWVVMVQDMVFAYYGPYHYRTSGLVIRVIFATITVYLALAVLVGAVGRAKQGCLIKNTLVYRLWNWLCKVWKKALTTAKEIYVNLPVIWRSVLLALAFGVWALLLWATAMRQSGFSVVLLLFALPIMVGLVLDAIQLRSLEKAGKALAAGELSYQVDTQKLTAPFKQHGENLNSISAGMYRAVESRLQSERMKTELVANVSHDIKNPLTSIINYAGLIAAENCENPNHREYAEVLGRKSEHLKRLLEDLVEISRANTGNLDVNLEKCDALTLLAQLAGEFSDRCTAAGLTLLIRQPETPLWVNVDSRRIWRVFENLMQNACKYSLSGSRVYLSLEPRGGNAVFTIRNTSREPLDMRPEELVERFVRGDRSRTSEGNGLGLSIAQSLTNLQGGEMAVNIDGDLFKVTLRFPMAE